MCRHPIGQRFASPTTGSRYSRIGLTTGRRRSFPARAGGRIRAAQRPVPLPAARVDRGRAVGVGPHRGVADVSAHRRGATTEGRRARDQRRALRASAAVSDRARHRGAVVRGLRACVRARTPRRGPARGLPPGVARRCTQIGRSFGSAVSGSVATPQASFASAMPAPSSSSSGLAAVAGPAAAGGEGAGHAQTHRSNDLAPVSDRRAPDMRRLLRRRLFPRPLPSSP